ncbi:hypothetical protein L3i23_02010 [Herbiconiux sp. L3-i23]|nr:hypothetical protein L3i23_02010 [Herbiconiux sp. L3-i23]
MITVAHRGDEATDDGLVIVTERLRLRPLTTDDRAALLGYRSLPDVCRYVPFPPMDEAEIDRRLTHQWAETSLEALGSARTLGVEERASGLLVGDVVLFRS